MMGCGGSGSSSTSLNNTGNNQLSSQTVSGVAATGTVISGNVYLKDSSNPAKEISTPINADGSFSFDVTGLTAPFLLKAVGTAGGQNYILYSLAGTPGIANINPLSNLAVVQANSGVDPASLYANLTPDQLQALKSALATVMPQIKTLLQQMLSQYGVATTNFISDTYTANHSGLDLLFDMIAIVINNGSLTISNKVNGASILATTLSGNILSGQIETANIPTISTQAVGAAYAYPASDTIATGGRVSFKAIVIGAINQAVTWSVIEAGGGSVTSEGVYTAPSNAGTYHVKATSVADASKSITTTVTVTATPKMTVDLSGVWKGTLTEITSGYQTAATPQNVSTTLAYDAQQMKFVGTIVGDKGLSASIYFSVGSVYWWCGINQASSWGILITPPTYNLLYTQSAYYVTSLQQPIENDPKTPLGMQNIVLADEYNVTMNGTTYEGGGFKQYNLILSRQ